MNDKKFSIDDIKELMDKMQKTGLGLMEIQTDDFSIKLEAKKAAEVQYSAAQQVAVASVEVSQPVVSEQVDVEATICGNEVKSPIVGTFYSSPSPDKPAFVKVGDKVKKGDTLFIIESMKLMNEIQSEFDGEVVEISVKDSQGVEYGQTIMTIA